MANHPKPTHDVRGNSHKAGSGHVYAKTTELVHNADNKVVYAPNVRFRAKTSTGAFVTRGSNLVQDLKRKK